MASVQASPPKLSPEQILEQMGQLALSDLEQVMNKGYYLLAEKKAPHLSKRETELFMEINKGFEQEFQDRYDLLKEKLENETMNLLENEEFIGMTEIVEARNVTRLQCIVELAQLRKVTVPELMNQLGLIKHNG
ncbi:MAG: hypothetical protein SFV55_19535 [Haliscomenobacter sp.]|uniref:hypothetical protein n=1 Tax=Haliscomenobacter sp. TaxID=2717303 RepID=UPI0029B9997C|nr:hypothetical protein [Haliscomenobacter sp.]MDX2070629.1 hypothetical protein [Haliscomenobacter sp.]